MAMSRLNAGWVIVSACVTCAAHAQTAPVPGDKSPLNEVIVSGYREGDASNISKSDIPALENAQAISVVTDEVMKSQGITRLADALRNVAGVSRTSTYGYFDGYQIRGYDAAYGSVFLDGLKNGNVAGEVHEVGGLEQVEVIKGPASGLYGAAPLGGVVNLVSKRPREGSFLDASIGGGSWDNREASIDANGELNSAGTVLARVNVIYRDGDDFVNFSHAERVYIAPAVTWNMGSDTSLTFLSRYQRDLANPWSPVPAYGTLLSNPNGQLPIDFSVNDDDQEAFYNQKSTQVGYAFEHRFSDRFNVAQNFRYERSKDDWDNWMFAAGISEDQTEIGRYFYGPTHYVTNDLGVDTRANLKVDTGSIAHSLLLGVDYANSRFRYTNNGLYDGTMNPLNLMNPDYSAPLVRSPDPDFAEASKSKQTGFYLQDHVKLTEKFTLTFGGRWDDVKSDSQQDNAFSPTVGGTFAVTPEAALYVNFAKSFTPTPSWQTDFENNLLPPERGRNIETGLKLVDSAGVLSGMVSIFELTRSNVATDDPEHPFFYIVTGEQRSRGVEVEGTWKPTDAWLAKAAYSYIEAEITKDNTYPVGMPLPNAPKNSLNLWGKYTVPTGPLAKVGLSLGVLHNSDKHFYELGSGLYTLRPYTLLDAGVSYGFGSWDAQLNFNNLTNERHYTDSAGLDRISPGEPRNWQLTVSKLF